MQRSSNLTVILSNECVKEDTKLHINVSFIIYVIGFMSFFSWIMFCVFGGIGIAALPLDLIYDFITRPKKRTFEEMQKIKEEIVKNATIVKNIANDAKELENRGCHKRFFMSSDKRAYNDKLTKLRAATYLLDKDYRMYKIQTELNEKLVFHYWLGLFLGIIFLIITIAWYLHM
jgi:LMBR1 domain-containing protein 1